MCSAGLIGGDALASGGLGAFIGFACPDFMRFDYLLGRANCQAYIRDEFVMLKENPLFDGWTAQQRTDLADASDPTMLPIIPLVGAAAVPQSLDPWPKGKLDPETLRDPIEARFRAVFQQELSGNVMQAALGWLGARTTQRYVADYVINAMKTYLVKAGLT